MARNYITASGHVPETPRFVATYQNNKFGRRVTVRDNFPHLDGDEMDTWGRDIIRIPLGPDDKVVPALAAAGFDLAGPWKTRRNESCAKLIRR